MNLKEVTLLARGALGAIASYPSVGIFIDRLPIGFSFTVALPHRGSGRRSGRDRDRIVSLQTASATSWTRGFSGLPSGGFFGHRKIIYLTRFPDYGAGNLAVRGLGTAVMHGTTLAILAATAHELAERENREATGDFRFNLLWFVPGYLVAVAIHTAFNQFPDRPLLAMMGVAMLAPVTLIGIFHFGTAEAERWLAADRAQHRAELAALRAGEWPEGPACAGVEGFLRGWPDWLRASAFLEASGQLHSKQEET